MAMGMERKVVWVKREQRKLLLRFVFLVKSILQILNLKKSKKQNVIINNRIRVNHMIS